MANIAVLNPGKAEGGTSPAVLVSDGHTAPVARRGKRLRQDEIERLLDCAQRAWSRASRGQRSVWFWWQGREYTSRLTGFRVLVDDANGEPVACRWS